jgi:hypothetical protein
MTRNQPKRIHYRYAPCAHGRYFNPMRRTENMCDVTCLSCKRRFVSLDLRPRTNYADVPTFEVHAVGRYQTFRGDWGTHLVFRCPVCGQENVHGGTYGKPGDGDGHRTSHCSCWSNGYVIREVTP